jgi:hypothetical protein
MNIYLADKETFPGLKEMKTEIPPQEELINCEIPEINPFYGMKHTEHTKKLMSKASKGKLKSIQHRINNGKAHEKNWIVTTPNDEVLKIKNLSRFCRENNLNIGTMSSVANGRHDAHKGYTVCYGETNN